MFINLFTYDFIYVLYLFIYYLSLYSLFIFAWIDLYAYLFVYLFYLFIYLCIYLFIFCPYYELDVIKSEYKCTLLHKQLFYGRLKHAIV